MFFGSYILITIISIFQIVNLALKNVFLLLLMFFSLNYTVPDIRLTTPTFIFFHFPGMLLIFPLL